MNAVSYLRPESAPHSVEAEQAILGAILLDARHIGTLTRRGGASLFHDPLHAKIFEVAAEKEKGGFLVSPITVHEVMRAEEGLNEVGGGKYLTRLAGAAPPSASVTSYADMLADLTRKRGIVAAISEASAAITKGEDPASHIAARLEAAITAVTSDDSTGPVSMLKAVSVAMDQIKAAYEGTSENQVRSGIADLDRMISGFYPGELVLIGGRPSMGKTGVALSIALNAARAGHGVVIASLEMNPEAMAMRALSEATAQNRAAVTYANMRKGDLSDPHLASLQSAAQQVAELPIVFLPRNYSDIGALFAGSKQAKRAMGDKMRLLIVDYAQLLRSSAKSRYEQITEISIALKALAGTLNVPVIALSQLSRGIESRDDKRPMLSDLRESGQLEQDADAVLFCYRDSYYLEREKPNDDAKAEDLQAWQDAMRRQHNKLEIIVAKQRQGEIGTAHVMFNPALNLVWDR